MNLFIKDDSSLMRIEDEMCSRNVTDRVVHTVDRCRRVPWITRPSFTISSLWRTTKWNPRISWKDLSLSRDVGEKKKSGFFQSNWPVSKTRQSTGFFHGVSRWFSLVRFKFPMLIWYLSRDVERIGLCAYYCRVPHSTSCWRISGISLIHLVED